ncbi:MAG: polysaccharide deacetylase family protein [Bacteroidota bacterium]
MMNSTIQQLKLGFFVKTKGAFSKPLYSGLGHILCFHRVLPDSGSQRITANSGMEISPEKLEWIIRYFTVAGYEVISLDTLAEILSGAIKPEKKFIVLTFDDGYIDNYTYAYPLLKSLNVPFTIFVATDYPAKNAVMWWYFLENYILENEKVTWVDENSHDVDYTATTIDEKEKLFLKLRMQFINRKTEDITKLLNQVMGISSDDIREFCGANAMSAAQIKELSDDSLVTIGAHTISHRPLSKLSDDDAYFEISVSKQILEGITGKAIVHFAYPFGSPNEYGFREMTFAEKAGYKTSVTLQQGNIFKGHEMHLHRLSRIPLGEKANKETLDNICNGIRHYSFNGSTKII